MEPRDYLRPEFEDNYAHYCAGSIPAVKVTLSPDYKCDPPSTPENTPPFEWTNAEGLVVIPYEEESCGCATPKARLFHNKGYAVWIPKSAIEMKHPDKLILKKWFKTPTWRRS